MVSSYLRQAGSGQYPKKYLDVLESFLPDEESLFLLMRDRFGLEELWSIAAADNGINFEENLADLKILFGNTGFDRAMRPELVGSLELACLLTDPEFSALLMLRAYGYPANRGLWSMSQRVSDLLGGLGENCIDALPEAASFLAWLVWQLPPGETETTSCLVALLYLALLEDPGKGNDVLLVLGEWILEAEQESFDRYGCMPVGCDEWLFRVVGPVRPRPWIRRAEKMAGLVTGIEDLETRETLELVIMAFSGTGE